MFNNKCKRYFVYIIAMVMSGIFLSIVEIKNYSENREDNKDSEIVQTIEGLWTQIQKEPNRVDLYIGLAKLGFQKDIPDVISAALRNALKKFSENCEVLLLLSEYFAKYHPDKPFAKTSALRAYWSARKQASRPYLVESARMLVKLNPQNVDYNLKLIEALRRLSESTIMVEVSKKIEKEALEIALKLLQDNPKNPDVLLEVAKCYSNLENYETALSYIEKCLAQGNINYGIYFLRGYIYHNMAYTKKVLTKEDTIYVKEKNRLALEDVKKAIELLGIEDNCDNGLVLYSLWATILCNLAGEEDKPKRDTLYDESFNILSNAKVLYQDRDLEAQIKAEAFYTFGRQIKDAEDMEKEKLEKAKEK
ncbi:MAG: hypothetical protein QME51_07265 [Planctomycetota bacterium]|nr:hypothetical protein [Planctomycetota bacterium]MDI6788153.1 hypothetical protein [Planctomycetota bacterium]